MAMHAHTPLPIWVQTIYVDAQVPVTSVRGEIDLSTDQVVQDEVTAQLAAKPRLLVLDLSQVAFMGSAGIHLVLRNHAHARSVGSMLAVVAEGYSRHVLTLSGIDGVLRLYRDVRTAIEEMC
ncbi:STAS domain-containing protein [Lentzea nigeriaca]|uniref:STAS domain-containing protein n=1 Tax=Lentzea nigeriaca TaxID=1128665 RepID=UPI00195CBDF7|nr:STAS domain-containing protein [Lentzea nigeriaca]MBM7858763.1 anti-anti-sigma factor [Lentzea nigeriaca]